MKVHRDINHLPEFINTAITIATMAQTRVPRIQPRATAAPNNNARPSMGTGRLFNWELTVPNSQFGLPNIGG